MKTYINCFTLICLGFTFYAPFKTVVCFYERIPAFLLFRILIPKIVQTLVGIND